MRALLLLLLAAPALAQEAPLRLPSRDVDVIYRAGPAAAPVEQRWRFRAADRKLRLDPAAGVWMILDYPAGRLTMVNEAEHGALDRAAPRGALLPGAGGGTTMTRRGTDVVAGVACTEWETTDTARLPTLACFTADGVMLRARRGTQVLVQAIRVTYAAADPSIFIVPSQYARRTEP